MITRAITALLAVMPALTMIPPAHAASLECTMRYDLSTWSLIYKRVSGTGVITCSDGSKRNAKISANGGGLAVGKSNVKGGKASFTNLTRIDDAFGTYLAADATTGLPKSGNAQVMTKGDVSVALAGVGRGFGMGVTIGGMTIEKAP